MKVLAAILFFPIATALVGCQSPKHLAQTPQVPSVTERAAWPKTVDEAVARTLAGMDDTDKATLRGAKKKDLFEYGYSAFAMDIRKDFGLRKGNTELLADCHKDNADDASMVIIEAIWLRLQKP